MLLVPMQVVHASVGRCGARDSGAGRFVERRTSAFTGGRPSQGQKSRKGQKTPRRVGSIGGGFRVAVLREARGVHVVGERAHMSWRHGRSTSFRRTAALGRAKLQGRAGKSA